MVRSMLLLGLGVGLMACGDGGSPVDAAGPVDAASADAVDCDGGCAAEGEACGTSDVDLDAGARTCAPGLVCCYPCGIPDCVDRCITPCTPGPGCQEGGCPGPFP
jgi:hypothetical protein